MRTDLSNHRRKLVAGLIVMGLAGAAGVAYGAISGSYQEQPEPVSYAPSEVQAPTTSGSLDQRVKELAERLPAITAATTGAGGVELSLSVRSMDPADFAEPLWQSHLFRGALYDELYASGDGTQPRVDATIRSADGQEIPVGAGRANVVPSQKFITFADSDALGEQIAIGAEAMALTDVQVELLRPLASAVVVRGRSSQPNEAIQALQTFDGLEKLLGQSPHALEGFFIEIADEDGTPIFITYFAGRAAVGGVWAAPAFRNDLITQPPEG